MLSQLLPGMIECKRSCANRPESNTGLSLCLRVVLVVLLLLALGPHVLLVTAQGLDAAALLKPTTDTWPTYNGDYSGRRFSALDQINPGNVGSLTLAWIFQPHLSAIKSTPLEVNGVLYFTVPDNVWAVDARFGREIWHYQRVSEGDHIGNRGLGMYKNWLYFTTPDAHLVCLDAKDGTVRWIVELADPKLGYFATMAPLIIRNHVVVGVSGDVTDVRGFLESRDPETGDVQWRWYTEPDPGQPGSETWPKEPDALLHGGGMTWMTGTYDPELDLLYWGTGNPNPVLAGEGRPGDNLYTCSIVALNPDTGKLAWYFQPSPHDVHDWDAVETPVLFDAEYKGSSASFSHRPAAMVFSFCSIERMASIWSQRRLSTRLGLPASTPAAARSLSRKPLPARTARWSSLVQMEPAIGWRPALIPRPACFM